MKKIFTLLVVVFMNMQINAQCWKEISTGDSHTLAIKTDGTLWAWGRASEGQIGNGLSGLFAFQQYPTQIGTDTNWYSLAAGAKHSLALKTNHSLWAWGDNSQGQLGDGTTINKTIPIQIGTDTTWKIISTGRDFSMNANAANVSTIMLSTGAAHALKLKSDGTIWALGDNSWGQLGDGGVSNYESNFKQIGNETDWAFVEAGYNSSYAIKVNGTLWSWGENTDGELGIGNNLDKNIPIQVGISTDWKYVSAARQHAAAIKTNNSLWSWGDNGWGQLGIGNGPGTSTPTQVGNSQNWDKVSAGIGHTLAIQFDKTLWGCGDNTALGIDNSTGYLKLVGCYPLSLEELNSKNIISIYPNPTINLINMACIVNQYNCQIRIIDPSGKIVLEQKTKPSQIDVSNLRKGVYLVQVISEEKTYQAKFVKE